MSENYHLGTTLSVSQWIDALQDKDITNDTDISILRALYSEDMHTAPASLIGEKMGKKGRNLSSPINLEIGRWGKRLVKKFPYPFTVRGDGTERKWDLFFDGSDEGHYFMWTIKSELVEAIKRTNMAEETYFPEELPLESQKTLQEGAKRKVTVNAYERNREGRQFCINHYKATCFVCGFNFEKVYGPIGKNFIHVHHLTKISDIGSTYKLNPINDLRPVCPNCHAMLHKKEPPYTIEELKEILLKQKEK